MQIVNVESLDRWEKILDSFKEVSFLQSYKWGEFQKQLGNRVNRVEIIDGDNLGAVQYYLVKSKIAKFLYCPRGPLATSTKAANILLDFLIKKASEESAIFIQIEPANYDSLFLPILKKRGFISQSSIQPQFSSHIALKPSVKDLFGSIRKTTRALIRKANKEGVIIKSHHDLTNWNSVSKLFLQTSARQKFISHPLSYIKTQFDNFPNETKLYAAEIKGKILTAAIILSYRKISTYLHAASAEEARNLGAAHLLVWTAIEDAKKKGDEFFDLWGVAPPNQLHHPWSGISVFKQGFGGILVSYPEAFILPIQELKFKLYKFVSYSRALPIFKMIQRILLKSKSSG